MWLAVPYAGDCLASAGDLGEVIMWRPDDGEGRLDLAVATRIAEPGCSPSHCWTWL